MRLVLTDAAGSITGTVVNTRKVGRAGLPRHRLRGRRIQVVAPSRFVRAASRGSTGRFTIDALLPGTYFVCAVDPLDDESWTDPDVLRRLRAIAEPIAVSAGEPHAITLTLKVLR